MRVLSVLLALSLWLGPVVQAYARTLSEAHCRPQGHAGMTAAQASQASPDSGHAAHHAQQGAEQSPTPTGDHGATHAQQCQCGCLCGHAGAVSAAILPGFYFADAPVPQHFDPAEDANPLRAEHPVPQRPPVVIS